MKTTPVADVAFSSLQTEEAVVLALWWFEVRNIRIVHERRGRINEQDTDFFLRALAQFRIRIDREPGTSRCLADGQGAGSFRL